MSLWQMLLVAGFGVALVTLPLVIVVLRIWSSLEQPRLLLPGERSD